MCVTSVALLCWSPLSSDPMVLEYQHIGLSGMTTGVLKFDVGVIDWRAGGNIKKFDPETVDKAEWTVYGTKGHLFLTFKDGKVANLDGFNKGDYDAIAAFFQSNYQVPVTEISVGGLFLFIFSSYHSLAVFFPTS